MIAALLNFDSYSIFIDNEFDSFCYNRIGCFVSRVFRNFCENFFVILCFICNSMKIVIVFFNAAIIGFRKIFDF